ncbi:3-ketoacyl-CoA synthase 11-like [Typha angustifolia]|uniref:3-ketoacyl-CoA synthase 11-like n=1 Tax=Typha angustifolia TaxID=59011 RepID=UPI003C2F8B27
MAENGRYSWENRLFKTLNIAKANYMKLLYHHFISYLPHLFLATLLMLLLPRLSALTLADVDELWSQTQLKTSTVIITSTLLALLATLYVANRPRPVYLVDMAGYKPSSNHQASRHTVLKQFESTGTLGEESMEFQRKILERSGIGDATYFPACLLSRPIKPCLATAREESETVVFGLVDEILRKTGVQAKDIGVLVVNCSLFNPTPSFTAMIVHRYKLRGNVITYNLGGMGCSAGVIAIDLAKNLLQVHPNSYALVISTENITLNGYFGNSRSMLVSNSLFRMGGAAILLSNRRADRRRAKYRLIHTVRIHRGADDRNYTCVTQEEDDDGKVGIALSKDLMAVAGEALKANITTLGPLVLPMSEQLLFLATIVLRKIFKLNVKAYIPDFKLAFEHFCIHAGGRGVLDELEKNLKLSPWHMEPSRMTLYRFGNTSSSSLWYELAYCEAKGRIKKGDRVWQIAFGSGFKCNSAVWEALRTVDEVKENPWIDEIDKFPVHVPKVVPIAP